MSTATNGICTYNNLKTNKSTYVNVSSDFTLTKCPTFAEIEHITKSGYMFDTSGYSSNQLVKYSDLKWVNLTSNVLYMEALEDNFSFSWYNDGRSGNATIKYSINNGSTWTDLTSNNSTVMSTTVNKGSRIYIKASGLTANPAAGVKYIAGIGTLNGTKKYKLGGNLRSLINGSSTLNNYQFAHLFLNDVNLISVSTTLLPFITLKTQCYYGMFNGCVNLENTPNLPALNLVENCYSYIFYNCNNLHYISLMCTTTPSTTYMNKWIGSLPGGPPSLPSFDGILYLNQNAQWNIEDINTVDTPYNYGWTIKKINPPIQQNPGGAIS